jgi:hypothetical protein
MVVTQDANTLSLGDVERLLKLQPQTGRSLSTMLSLQSLSAIEEQELGLSQK